MFDEVLIKKVQRVVTTKINGMVRVSQNLYLIEEMSELTKELIKAERGKGNDNNIKEEIADVLCALLMYTSDNNINIDELRSIMIKKLDRCIARLDIGEQ